MATFVDSHVHLADPAFDDDRNDVIERARLTGARALLCVGESIAAAQRARDVARQYPGFVFWSAGIHPHDAHAFDVGRDITAIRMMIAQGAVAIGECGLDNHYDHSPRSRQLEAFEAQLALAKETAVPVIVHTRQAVEDTSRLIGDAGKQGITGVLHCFTGPRELAERALDAGWYLSFSGVISFRKWTDDALIRLAPSDRILVESDAPYLAPVPHRGKRNEPAWVSLTLARAAEARGLSAGALGEMVSANASRLFGLGL
ncbi:MAG TPA: TatD family hydrolase [Gemmatimonadaceae bacterium]|nr:TatD family hydrolase [Gemmatimonadaceae bacterium]